ncbi:SGNH/GDSL hydrolase family protein [Lentisphaera profundi]|uniref:SGNH/GDSL hydrolase family protein n=1 Tax=Lentisphaera profundi TaxID=1658616 RepID=A0ABY7VV54_9BACT|nr:SGNH/GDSL hydrolase family protein [Lentisphaera profundi]WDE97163.1 SGNH/GDSL hydrolase family protein [Lentisphaera profundi]
MCFNFRIVLCLLFSLSLLGEEGLVNFVDLKNLKERSSNRFIDEINTQLMRNESLVFCSDLQARKARLLFDPIKLLSVKRADGSADFVEGEDYLVSADGWLTLTANSRIPVLNYYSKTMDRVLYRFVDVKGKAFYSPGGTRKHSDWDIVVSYTHAKGSLDEMAAGSRASSLTVPLEKLRDKLPLNVTFFGDSITFGAQASSLGKGVFPYAPAYPIQLVDALKKRFEYEGIHYANKAVGGKTTLWGVKEIKQLMATKPDLVVLAFGMNDGSGGVATSKYKENTETMIEALRLANPDVGIVLVAEFSPNPEWGNANYERRKQNRDALYELYSKYDNMAFVDVGAVSRQIASRKKFQDFSGNNINHPNDFMHAVYAYLLESVISTSAQE